MKIITIENCKKLASDVADTIGVEIGKSIRKDFADGEFTVGYQESLRGERVYIIGSTNMIRGNNNLLELCMKIRAARDANAKEIIVIIPYFGWGRADRKDLERSCVTSKLVSEWIEIAGATQVITFDLHAIQTQAFFNIPSDHFLLDKLYANHIKQNSDMSKLKLAAPDMGASKRVSKVSGLLNDAELVIFYKERNPENNIKEMKLLGDVKGCDIVFLDDIADSGNTLITAAALAKEKGAKKITAYCSHGVLSGKAIENIEKSDITDFYITDSITCDLGNSTKIKVLSMAKIIANIINKINNNLSLSNL